MTTIPESTMREARKLACVTAAYFDAHVNAIARALHAARQDQIRKDAQIARQNGRDFSEALMARPASVCFGIATAIETQGGEK